MYNFYFNIGWGRGRTNAENSYFLMFILTLRKARVETQSAPTIMLFLIILRKLCTKAIFGIFLLFHILFSHQLSNTIQPHVFAVKGQLQRFHKLSLFDRFRHVENGFDINF